MSEDVSDSESAASIKSFGDIGLLTGQSLIFERNVEDPGVSLDSPEPLDGNSGDHPLSVIGRRRTFEDCIPPALDEGSYIVTDSNTELKDIGLVTSRNSSLLGLDRALGGPVSRSLSRTTTNPEQSSEDPPRLMRYCSYADMLTEEHNPVRRPSFSRRNYSFSPGSLTAPPLSPKLGSRRFSTNTNPQTNLSRSSGSVVGGLTSPRHKTTSQSPLPHKVKYYNHFRMPKPQNNQFSNSNIKKDIPQTAPASVRAQKRSQFHIESSGSEDLSADEYEAGHTHLSYYPSWGGSVDPLEEQPPNLDQPKSHSNSNTTLTGIPASKPK